MNIEIYSDIGLCQFLTNVTLCYISISSICKEYCESIFQDNKLLIEKLGSEYVRSESVRDSSASGWRWDLPALFIFVNHIFSQIQRFSRVSLCWCRKEVQRRKLVSWNLMTVKYLSSRYLILNLKKSNPTLTSLSNVKRQFTYCVQDSSFGFNAEKDL